MTPEQVIAALKAFAPDLVLNKRYSTNPNKAIGEKGLPDECTDKNSIRLFVAIIAAKGTTFLGGYGCGVVDYEKLPGSEPETVVVYLTPEPGNHRVIAVSRWKSFTTPTTVDTVIESAMKKYPTDFTAKSKTDDEYIVSRAWRFDVRGRIMSETVARQSRLVPREVGTTQDSDLPGTVFDGGGVGLDLAIGTGVNNHKIAQTFRVSLYDENALYHSMAQTKAVYNAIHEKQLKEETDKAKQSSAPVKM